MPSSLFQIVNSLFQTCYNNWEQAVRTQLVDSLRTQLVTTCLQTCYQLVRFWKSGVPDQLKLAVFFDAVVYDLFLSSQSSVEEWKLEEAHAPGLIGMFESIGKRTSGSCCQLPILTSRIVFLLWQYCRGPLPRHRQRLSELGVHEEGVL
jgi:hypothetical protein